MNEDSILHPSQWPDAFEELARWIPEMEREFEEAEQEKQVTNLEPAE
ncbi:hypothetical protein [Microvirga lotononidis]|uniref:Uncharacterized protein n=1 Tax=Microvirga lotononidis TaxID=864069 RepID=I4YP16_9HYPH|nr:hypothetical protein [Microvirga lotononidis]EIM25708.1 hypothetical protein MicloDRAFT_00064350 [Microvirga lotononidis]WQO25644.1 hypothetical protein U0023_13050 [Microvirga lotononidis]